MSSLIYLAAAIPFIIVVVVVVVFATVRYSITTQFVLLSILGIGIWKIPLADIEALEYFTADSRKGWGLLHRGGTVVVMTRQGKTFAVMPKDAESFYNDLKDEIFRSTGRRV